MEWCNKANFQLLLSVAKLGKKWTSISKYISLACFSLNEDEKSKFDSQKCSVQYNYLLETTRQANIDNENLSENELLEKAKLHYLMLRKQEIYQELVHLEEKESINKQEKELIKKGQYSSLKPETILFIRKYCRAHNMPDHLGALLNLTPLPKNSREDATILLEENRIASVNNCLAEAMRIWSEEASGQNMDDVNADEWIPIDENQYKELIEWQPCQLTVKYPNKRVYRHEKMRDIELSTKRNSNSSLQKEESSLATVLSKPVIHWSEIELCTGRTNPWNLDASPPEAASQESMGELSVPLTAAITEGDYEEPLAKFARHSDSRDDLQHSLSDPTCQSEIGLDDSSKISTMANSPASSSASGGLNLASSSWSSANHPMKSLTKSRTKSGKVLRQSSARVRGRSRCEDSPLPDSSRFGRSHSVFLSEANVWQVPDNLECDRKRWRKSMITALSSIMTHRHSHVFTHPVTDELAPGYSDIVLKPMDLSTIRRRLDSGEIQTTGQFLRDLLLMFTNARMYNSSSHEVYKMAEEMAADILVSLLPLWNKSDSKAQGPGLNLRGSNLEISTPTQTPIIPVSTKKVNSKTSNRTRQCSSSSEASIPPIFKK